MKASSLALALALAPAAAGLLCGPAHAQVAVVMAPGASPLSKEQVANVYLGRSTELHPLDLPEGSATREAFYKKAAERDAAQVKKAVAGDAKAVGYMEKAAVDASVKVVLMLE